jgi:hypothetical protein
VTLSWALDTAQPPPSSNCGQAAPRAVVKTPCRSHSPVSARTEPKVELRILRPGIARSSAAGAPVKNRQLAHFIVMHTISPRWETPQLNCLLNFVPYHDIAFGNTVSRAFCCQGVAKTGGICCQRGKTWRGSRIVSCNH